MCLFIRPAKRIIPMISFFLALGLWAHGAPIWVWVLWALWAGWHSFKWIMTKEYEPWLGG